MNPPAVVPDLVVEVLSPGNKSRDRGEKKGIYQRNGVAEYWIMDAVAEEVTVFGLVERLSSRPAHLSDNVAPQS